MEPGAAAWLASARGSLLAARQLLTSEPRSASSRAYYASFAAAHAVLLHLRPDVEARPRGHFRHGELPGQLRWTLLHKAGLRMTSRQADYYKDALNEAYNIRVRADYEPRSHVSALHAGQAESLAAALVRLAERIVK
jgi:uncharacterized protein (UPF0332 family)